MFNKIILPLFIFLITLFFLSCGTENETEFSDAVYLSSNGVTIVCPEGVVGEVGVVDGVKYEIVDRNLLIKRRDEGSDLSKVCVSNVTDMSLMFLYESFNQPIGNWDVSSVTNMFGMFRGSPFNQTIENWDVSSVTNMIGMFASSQFNQPIGDWDVSSVTKMIEMFRETSFNQDISQWCVENITSEPFGFSTESPLTEENKPVWGTCPSN